MPLYTYECSHCGFTDEVIQDIKKRDKKFSCEQEGCPGVMERIIDLSDFHLKGNGWYKQVKEEKKKEWINWVWKKL